MQMCNSFTDTRIQTDNPRLQIFMKDWLVAVKKVQESKFSHFLLQYGRRACESHEDSPTKVCHEDPPFLFAGQTQRNFDRA